MNPIIKNGLLLAAAMLAIYAVVYFVDPSLNASSVFNIAFFTIVGFAFIVLSVFQVKKKNEGDISFGEAFISGFGTFSIGIGLFLIMWFVHYSTDTDYAAMIDQSVKDQAIEMASSITQAFNMEGEDFDKAMEQIEKQDFSTGIGTLMLRILSNVMWGAILALGGGLVSIIFKNR